MLNQKKIKLGSENMEVRKYVLENKNRLVMKPFGEHMGKNVFLGKNTTHGQWKKLVEENCNKKRFIVQEYVVPPKIPIIKLEEKKIKQVERYFNFNPYFIKGEYAGAITRFSDKEVVNVARGGGIGVTFVLREKWN